jgi:hypothetical protein
MDGEEMRKRWNGMSEEIISGMAEWRQQHPKATFCTCIIKVDTINVLVRARIPLD